MRWLEKKEHVSKDEMLRELPPRCRELANLIDKIITHIDNEIDGMDVCFSERFLSSDEDEVCEATLAEWIYNWTITGDGEEDYEGRIRIRLRFGCEGKVFARYDDDDSDCYPFLDIDCDDVPAVYYNTFCNESIFTADEFGVEDAVKNIIKAFQERFSAEETLKNAELNA